MTFRLLMLLTLLAVSIFAQPASLKRAISLPESYLHEY